MLGNENLNSILPIIYYASLGMLCDVLEHVQLVKTCMFNLIVFIQLVNANKFSGATPFHTLRAITPSLENTFSVVKNTGLTLGHYE